MDARRIVTIGVSWIAAMLALNLAGRAYRLAVRLRPRTAQKWAVRNISL